MGRGLEESARICQEFVMRKAARKLPPVRSHQWIDLVDLEMSRRIARKIRQDPSLMRVPKANLRRWRRKFGYWPPAFREWADILKNNPLPRVLEILTQDNDEGQRLRQSDPFVGILTVEERRRFFKGDEDAAT